MASPESQSRGYMQIVQQHQMLKDLLAQIDQVLEARTATIEEASALLAQLGDQLVRHFATEENGGYFSETLLHAPRLVARANDLMAQHPKMCRQAQELIVALAPARPAEDWWQETRRRFDAFCQELGQHERGEDCLIQEAYNRDIGPSD